MLTHPARHLIDVFCFEYVLRVAAMLSAHHTLFSRRMVIHSVGVAIYIPIRLLQQGRSVERLHRPRLHGACPGLGSVQRSGGLIEHHGLIDATPSLLDIAAGPVYHSAAYPHSSLHDTLSGEYVYGRHGLPQQACDG